MASVYEHQLRTMYLFSGMGCVIEEGKSVVGALSNECRRCGLNKRQRGEIGFI